MYCEVAFGAIVEGAQATDTDVIVGGEVVDCTSTEAAPDFVVSSVLVAVTVRFPVEAGAVKSPLELMLPPLVDHFTVELQLAVPCTVAAHCEVAFVAIVEGAQATVTEVMVVELGIEDWLPLLPQLVKAVKNRATTNANRWRGFTGNCSWRGDV